MNRMTAFAAAAATALALGAGPVAAGPTNEKVTICHATGGSTSVTPTNGGQAFTATRGVVISVPLKAAVNHLQRHGDVPFLDDNEVGADKKCLIGPNFNILDPDGNVIQDTRQELQDFINTLPQGELRNLLQQLLNRLVPA